MPEGFQTVHRLMLQWFFSEESEQYQRNEKGTGEMARSVYGSMSQVGLNGEGGGGMPFKASEEPATASFVDP